MKPWLKSTKLISFIQRIVRTFGWIQVRNWSYFLSEADEFVQLYRVLAGFKYEGEPMAESR